MFAAGDQLEGESNIPVVKGKEKTVQIALEEGFQSLVKKGEEELYDITYHLDEAKLTEDGELTAPIEKGEVVGIAELVKDSGVDYGNLLADDNKNFVNLITLENVEKQNWFKLSLSAIGDFFVNIFTVVIDWIKGFF